MLSISCSVFILEVECYPPVLQINAHDFELFDVVLDLRIHNTEKVWMKQIEIAVISIVFFRFPQYFL